ncbi:MAG TPA: response regulator transcription factor [Opitutaceae bacterium]|nr:response regulator transcription factor [Opitutaceae bacterium]
MAPKPLRVAVVEDEALLRELLHAVCESKFGCKVIAAVGDGREAVDAILHGLPDIVLLDLRLPQLDGFGVITAVRSRGFFPRILILSAVCDSYTAFMVDAAGVHGFLYKSATMLPALYRAILAVSRGERFFCPVFQSFRAARLNDPLFFGKILSAREQTVLAMFSDRMTDPEIAGVLGVSPRTVESHRMNILRKLGFRSKIELERYARNYGFTHSWTAGGAGFPASRRGGGNAPPEGLTSRM